MNMIVRCANGLKSIVSSRTPMVNTKRWKSIRDVHKDTRRVNSLMEGTSGAESYLTVNTANIEQHFPTVETLTKEFHGIPYNEIPLVYIKATKNNTLIDVVDYKNRQITYTSCRMEGFKHARKKTTIAGQTTGTAAGQRLLRRGINAVRVLIRGIGPGRMSAVKGIAASGVNVVSITDRTDLPENGPRPKKVRRV